MSEIQKNHYFKITNENEIHNGFQYRDGLNILREKFNDNPNDSCVKGGFYFTTREFIHKFYNYGIYLRIVELPTNDSDFKMVKDPHNDKWRANKIILGKKYWLGNVDIYPGLGIKYPPLLHCVIQGYLEIVKHFVSIGTNIHTDDDYFLVNAVVGGHLDVVKYLVEQGLNIHTHNELPLKWAARDGHLKIVKYLVKNGADIHCDNDYALSLAIKNNQKKVAEYLSKN